MLYIIKKDYFLADYIVDPLNDRENIIVVKYKRNKYKEIKRLFATAKQSKVTRRQNGQPSGYYEENQQNNKVH